MYYFSALKANARKAYAQITRSRITVCFFVFSFIYCMVQSILQSLIFSVDIEYRTLITGIVKHGNIPASNFTFIQGPRGHLQLELCNGIPQGQIPYPCTTIFTSGENSTRVVKGLNQRPRLSLYGWEKGLNVTTAFNNASNVIGVQIKTPDSPMITLSERCVQTLIHPSQILQNFKHEDTTWVCLQFWLLAISFLAVVYDSVPHTLAALITRTLETAWAVYATWRGLVFRVNYEEILSNPGTPCSWDLFQKYWSTRNSYEFLDLILSTIGLILFSYLSLMLLKVYNAQSFKCVGAPQHIMRNHKFFMAVLVCLQLEVFLLVTSTGLWIQVLKETAMAHISPQAQIYQGLYIGTMILLLPWIAMGWYSIRREMKRMMILFLGIAFVIIVSWLVMFYSIVYRWSFIRWPYLGCYTVASLFLLVASIVLGIICRMNFGNGLAEYLHAEETLASMNFAPDSFLHDTTHVEKNIEMKILDIDLAVDRPQSKQIFLINALPTNSSDSDLDQKEASQHDAPL